MIISGNNKSITENLSVEQANKLIENWFMGKTSYVENNIVKTVSSFIEQEKKTDSFYGELIEDDIVHYMDFLPKQNFWTKETYTKIRSNIDFLSIKPCTATRKQLNKLKEKILKYLINHEARKNVKEIFNNKIRLSPLNDKLIFGKVYDSIKEWQFIDRTMNISKFKDYMNRIISEAHLYIFSNEFIIIDNSGISHDGNEFISKHVSVDVATNDYSLFTFVGSGRNIDLFRESYVPNFNEDALINFIRNNFIDEINSGINISYIRNTFYSIAAIVKDNTKIDSEYYSKWIEVNEIEIRKKVFSTENDANAFDIGDTNFFDVKYLVSSNNLSNINTDQVFYINLTDKNICLQEHNGFTKILDPCNVRKFVVPMDNQDSNELAGFDETILNIINSKREEILAGGYNKIMFNVVKELLVHLKDANDNDFRVFAIVKRQTTSLDKLRDLHAHYSYMVSKYPKSKLLLSQKQNCELMMDIINKTNEKLRIAIGDSGLKHSVYYGSNPYIMDSVYFIKENDLTRFKSGFIESLNVYLTVGDHKFDISNVNTLHPDVNGINSRRYCTLAGYIAAEKEYSESNKLANQGNIEIIVNGKFINENQHMFRKIGDIKFYQRVGEEVIELQVNKEPNPNVEEGIYIYGNHVTDTGLSVGNIYSTGSIKPILFKYNEDFSLQKECIDRMKHYGIFLTKEEARAYHLKEDTEIKLSEIKVTESENKVKISDNSVTESKIKLAQTAIGVGIGVIAIPFIKFIYTTISTDGIAKLAFNGVSLASKPIFALSAASIAFPLIAMAATAGGIAYAYASAEQSGTGNIVTNTIDAISDGIITTYRYVSDKISKAVDFCKETCKKVGNKISSFFKSLFSWIN